MQKIFSKTFNAGESQRERAFLENYNDFIKEVNEFLTTQTNAEVRSINSASTLNYISYFIVVSYDP